MPNQRVKLNTPPPAADATTYFPLLNLPADILFKELHSRLRPMAIMALRAVCKFTRQLVSDLPFEPTALYAEDLVCARADAPSMPMVEWLRAGQPRQWFSRTLWVRRALERGELNTLQFFLPSSTTHVLDTLMPPMTKTQQYYLDRGIVNHRIVVGERANERVELHMQLLTDAAGAPNPRIADWLRERGLLTTERDLGFFLGECGKSGFGPVAKRACIIYKHMPATLIDSTATVCAQSDDVDFITFLDGFNTTKTCKNANGHWQTRAALVAAAHGSKRVLAWAFGRAKDPRAFTGRLLSTKQPIEQCTPKQSAAILEALQTRIAQL